MKLPNLSDYSLLTSYMLDAEAIDFIAPAIPQEVGIWADFGAGDGTFTRALAGILQSGSRVYAVDRDEASLGWIRHNREINGVKIFAVVEDFAREFEVGEESSLLVDGMLFANSLHFVKNQSSVLARLTRWLRPGGTIVLVEYDRQTANRWVPFPVPIAALQDLTTGAGLSNPRVIATRPSAYQGMMYAAVMQK